MPEIASPNNIELQQVEDPDFAEIQVANKDQSYYGELEIAQADMTPGQDISQREDVLPEPVQEGPDQENPDKFEDDGILI